MLGTSARAESKEAARSVVLGLSGLHLGWRPQVEQLSFRQITNWYFLTLNCGYDRSAQVLNGSWKSKSLLTILNDDIVVTDEGEADRDKAVFINISGVVLQELSATDPWQGFDVLVVVPNIACGGCRAPVWSFINTKSHPRPAPIHRAGERNSVAVASCSLLIS